MQTLRHLKFLLAVLAIALLQAGTPVLAYARMAQDGGLTRAVCTPAGMKTYVVDADGNAREVEASTEHGDPCPLCAVPPALPGAAPTPLPSSAAPCGVIRVGQSFRQSGAAVAVPPATGPPPSA